MTIPIERAREVFGTYAGMDAPLLPDDSQSCLQVQLSRWQTRNFGGANLFEMLAGATEEVGELAHAILKHHQKIRGLKNEAEFREAAGDAAADIVIYVMQLCTLLRLDFGTLVSETAQEVMLRNWKDNPDTAHEWKSEQLNLPPVCNEFVENTTGPSVGCGSCGKPTSAHPSVTIV